MTGPGRECDEITPVEAVDPHDKRYQWIALSNTTVGMFMASLDSTIVIIAMPAIFRGIGLDPLVPSNIGYLMWMVLGYLLVTAVLVVSVGRLGDMYGRVRMYNLGFLIFSLASLALSLDPLHGGAGAMWLILLRLVQAVGGSMITANAGAILTDAFPREKRGFALGINQMAALIGQFFGLIAGGLLATIDWRAVFWINVPIGLIGTVWSYRTLRETGERHQGRIDWAGNLLFIGGLSLLLFGMTSGIQPYGSQATGWENPVTVIVIGAGIASLIAFLMVERRTVAPMLDLAVFRVRAFAAGAAAVLLIAISRGGLQFMLIIWLQGVWLPLHGYSFSQTPLWAGIYLIPLSAGIVVAGPLAGRLSDRFGARAFATGGAAMVALSFVGMLFLPVDFAYPPFAALLVLSGLGQGMFSAPNTAAMLSSIPARHRGAGSGLRLTLQNGGTALSIGLFFSLMTVGLANSLPRELSSGLQAQGVSPAAADHAAHLPPVSTLFSAFLGENPVRHLLGASGMSGLSPSQVATLTGTDFFPHLIKSAFGIGLVVVLVAAILMCVVAAAASSLRGPDRPDVVVATSPVIELAGGVLCVAAGVEPRPGEQAPAVTRKRRDSAPTSRRKGLVMTDSSPDANKEIVRGFFDAITANDFARAEELIDPAGSWRIPRRGAAHQLSRQLENLRRENITFEVEVLTAEADRVSALVQGCRTGPDGAQEHKSYHFLIALLDSRIIDVNMYDAVLRRAV